MCGEIKQLANLLNADDCLLHVFQPGQSLHEAGGLQMGHHSNRSVVDPQGCFWQIKNLAVVDNSTWPSQGAANPYLTITACALRHAAKLNKIIKGTTCLVS